MDLSDLDGLVVIHPDFAGHPDYVKNPPKQFIEYPDNLLDAVYLVQQEGKPVFLVRQTNEIGLLEIQLMTTPVYSVNVHHKSRKEQEIDFIASVLGKKPEEIRLGFGGTYANACVHNIASSWCKILEKGFKARRTYLPPKEGAIGYGRIIDEISILGNAA